MAKVFINPYAAVPSMHCAFALMIGGTGVMVCAPLAREGLLGRLAAARRLGRDRHRQPLLDRRGARLRLVAATAALVAHRLLARARPEAWSWRAGAPQEAEA